MIETQTPKPIAHAHRRLLQAVMPGLLLALLAALLAVGSALANFITINTNDGQDDSNWAETPFRTDAVGDAGRGYDIRSFWMGSDAFPANVYYFRAELDAPLPAESYLEVRLDCNLNGQFYDASDMLVEYLPSSSIVADVVYVMQGDGNGTDSYRPDYGEATATSGAYEWKTPTNGTNTDWASCTGGQVSVRLATVSFPALRDEDLTNARTFTGPTAVELLELGARSGAGPWPLGWLAAAAGCLLAGMWLKLRL